LVFWGLILLGAVLFFISSFGYTVSLEFFLRGLESGILVLIVFLLVASVIWGREDKFRAQKRRLARKLRRQKAILRQRFDAQQNLSPEISPDIESSLNFAVPEETKTVPEALGTPETPQGTLKPDPDEALRAYLNESQLNLAKILIEGENVSSFPAEWQQFFAENEDKEPIEKLNSMLKNGENNQKPPK